MQDSSLTFISLLRKDIKHPQGDEYGGISSTFLVELNILYLHDRP